MDPFISPSGEGVATSTEVAASTLTAGPSFEPGNVTFVLIWTAFVMLMSVAGLTLFYGGMARAKNVVSTVTQAMTIFCTVSVLWIVYGYSLAFSTGNAFIGGLSKVMLQGVVLDTAGQFVATGTFSKGVAIPELAFAIFQATFAGITTALIVGGYAERMKFKAALLFSIFWFTLSYLPICHMVWWWPGPDAYPSYANPAEPVVTPEMAKAVAGLNATAGWLWQKGALDFAGGSVVHIQAGVAGLICACLLSKRQTQGEMFSVPMSATGAVVLWFGWFGFNTGSNLEANGYAALAFANTFAAAVIAGPIWLFLEKLCGGKWSLFGFGSGIVAGLVGITPACGFVGIGGALIIGAVSSGACYFACTKLKHWLGYDDAYDAFGVHAVGGIVGAVLTGIFVNPALGGTGYVIDGWIGPRFGYEWTQVWTQVQVVGVTIAWTTAATLVSAFFAGLLSRRLRVSKDIEAIGLDEAEHGEQVCASI